MNFIKIKYSQFLCLFFIAIVFVPEVTKGQTVKCLDEILAIATDNTKLPLPDKVDLHLEDQDIDLIFKNYANSYQKEFNSKKFQHILEKLLKEETLTHDEIDFLQGEPMKIIKRLRNAFIALDKSHEVPQSIDELATIFGHIKDGISANNSKYILEQAKKANNFYKKSGEEKVIKSLLSFNPSTHQSFDLWMKGAVVSIDQVLASRALTPREFHEIRKLIAQVKIPYEVKNEMLAQKDLNDVINFISRIKDDIGEEHDIYMRARIQKTIDYEHDKITLRKETRHDLERTVAFLKKSLKNEAALPQLSRTELENLFNEFDSGKILRRLSNGKKIDKKDLSLLFHVEQIFLSADHSLELSKSSKDFFSLLGDVKNGLDVGNKEYVLLKAKLAFEVWTKEKKDLLKIIKEISSTKY